MPQIVANPHRITLIRIARHPHVTFDADPGWLTITCCLAEECSPAWSTRLVDWSHPWADDRAACAHRPSRPSEPAHPQSAQPERPVVKRVRGACGPPLVPASNLRGP